MGVIDVIITSNIPLKSMIATKYLQFIYLQAEAVFYSAYCSLVWSHKYGALNQPH